MDITTFLDSDFRFAVLDPGARPAVVYAFKGRGTARIALLPAVATLEAIDLPAEDVAAALAWVHAARDRCLAAWMAEAPVHGETQALAREVAYDRARRALMIGLASGTRVLLPVGLDPSLAGASEEGLADVEVIAGGELIRWPRLTAYRRVSDLVAAATGLAPWRREVPEGAPSPAGPQARPDPAPAPAPVPKPAAVTAPPPKPAAPPAPPGPPPPGPGRIKSLLGLILYRENYLTQTQLQQIFQEQMRLRKDGQEVGFGKLAIDLGMITKEQLEFGVHLQNSLAHSADGTKPLGVFLLESSVVIPSQLLAALEEQKASGERLGELLVRKGLMSRETLDTFLGMQRQQQAPAPAPAPAPVPVAAGAGAAPAAPPPTTDPALKATLLGTGMKSLLGIILERENYITQAQVRAVIEEQDTRRKAGKKVGSFGEIALDMGMITSEQLKFAVQLQAKLAYTPGKPKPLGFFLLENGVIKPSQLQLALDEATRKNKRIGEVLVEHGVVSEQMVEVFLKIQQSQAASS